MIRNSSFPCFMAVFMSYCPQIWGSRHICMPRKNAYMFERYDKKPAVFAFYGCFHELLPAFFLVQGRFTTTLRPDTFLRVVTKNLSFSCFMVIFLSYCPQFLGSS